MKWTSSHFCRLVLQRFTTASPFLHPRKLQVKTHVLAVHNAFDHPYFVLIICQHSTKKPVTTMLTYPWKCTVLHCNHLGNTWKPLVLMTQHFDYCLSASKGDNQSVRSSTPVVSRCFPGGYNVKLYISRGRLAWWLLAFLHSAIYPVLSHIRGLLPWDLHLRHDFKLPV